MRCRTDGRRRSADLQSGAEAARHRHRRANATSTQRSNEADRSRRRRASELEDEVDVDATEGQRSKRQRRVSEGGGDAGAGHQGDADPNINQQRVVPWWERLENLASSTQPFTLQWNKPCEFCGAELLESESKAFCCGNGKAVLPTLEPYPIEIRSLILRDVPAFAGLSRKLNNMFCFTTLGTTGGFLTQNDRCLPPGAPTVVLNGRTYHNARAVDHPGHSVLWLMYDQDARDQNDLDQGPSAL